MAADLFESYEVTLVASIILGVPAFQSIFPDQPQLWAIGAIFPLAARAIGVLASIVGLVVTVVVHFPINAEIATWQPAASDTDWHQFQQQWLTAHAVRTVAALAGFVLLVVVGTRRRDLR